MGILSKVIDNDTLKKIGELVDRPINQKEKADKYKKWLGKCDLETKDMGTNRQVYMHEDYPGVVFKVALDEQGVLDNLNEYEKSNKSKYFPNSQDIDRDGFILVQDRKKTYDVQTFQSKETRKKIRAMLTELDEAGFVLIDLGSDKHKNFGYDKKGNVFVIDFGYVEYKSLANFNCPHYRIEGDKQKYCKGTLHYNKTFTMLECDKCGNVFMPDVTIEGYTATKYAEPPKEEKFKPSAELNDFYKRFTKTRDRSTLKKYVEISNTPQNASKGDMSEMNFKEMYLSKFAGRASTSEAVRPHEPVGLPDPKLEPYTDEVQKSALDRVGIRRLDLDETLGTPEEVDVDIDTDEAERIRRAFERLDNEEDDDDESLISNARQWADRNVPEMAAQVKSADDLKQTLSKLKKAGYTIVPVESVIAESPSNDQWQEQLRELQEEFGKERSRLEKLYSETQERLEVVQAQASLLEDERKQARQEIERLRAQSVEVTPVVVSDNDPQYRVNQIVLEALKDPDGAMTEQQLDEVINYLTNIRYKDGGRPEYVEVTNTTTTRVETGTVDSDMFYQEAGVLVTVSAKEPGEVHIGFAAEELNKRPILIMSKDGNVFYVDLLEHLTRLVQFLPEDAPDQIITSMVADPVSKFDKDYDSKYFDDESSDELED